MKKGDTFYVTDPQTNTILERKVLDVVDGMVLWNFRDETIQKGPVDNFIKYMKHFTKEEAEKDYEHFRQIEIERALKQIESLKRRIERLERKVPVYTDHVGTYKEINNIGKKGRK
jgi:hypothetical protein